MTAAQLTLRWVIGRRHVKVLGMPHVEVNVTDVTYPPSARWATLKCRGSQWRKSRANDRRERVSREPCQSTPFDHPRGPRTAGHQLRRPRASLSRKKLSRGSGVHRMSILEPSHRRCTGCGSWLPLEDFPANRRMHLGVSSRCRACHREATKDWRDRHRDEINAARRLGERESECVDCGSPFLRRSVRAVRCLPCRQARKRAQRKAAT